MSDRPHSSAVLANVSIATAAGAPAQTSDGCDHRSRVGNGPGVAAAYDSVIDLIAMARALVAAGAEVDLAPIRPAIRDLCDRLKAMPKKDAAEWLARLVELQRELARLGQEFAERGRNGDRSSAVSEEPGE